MASPCPAVHRLAITRANLETKRVHKSSSSSDEQSAKNQLSKRASWRHRLWPILATGTAAIRQAEMAVEEKDLSFGSELPAANETTISVSKWKALLTRFRFKGHELHRVSKTFTSSIDSQRTCSQSMGSSNKNDTSKLKSPLQNHKQKPYVHPEPMPLHPLQYGQSAIAIAPLWQRRKAARPATLDLSFVKATGMKKMSRARRRISKPG